MVPHQDGGRRAENRTATPEVAGPGQRSAETAEVVTRATGGQPGGGAGTAQLGFAC